MTSAYLLDINLLIALAWPQHVHHAQAHRWFGSTGRAAWATCAITQLGFIRLSANPKIIPSAVGPRDAAALLRRMQQLPGHRFWSDEIAPTSAAEFSSPALVGHRQVTDAYLLALARHHGGRLATFDRGITHLVGRAQPVDRWVELVDLD